MDLLKSSLYRDRFISTFSNCGDIKMFTSKSFKDPKRPHIALTHLNPYLSENMMSISSDFNNFVLYLTQCHINSLNNGYNIINLYTDALAPLSNDNLSINKNKIKNSNLVYKS